MAKGKAGPVDVFVYLAGYDLGAESLNDIPELDHESETVDTTGFGVAFRTNAPTGLSKAALALNGAIFNTCAGRSHIILKDGPPTSPQTAARLVVVGVAGTTVGAECFGFEGAHQIDYKVINTFEDVQRANARYLVTGARDKGLIVHPNGQETTDGNTQSTSIDNGAGPTTFGGAAHLQMSAFNGAGDALKAEIQDSSDNVTFATLIAFASASATGTPTALRGTVSGEVQRYVADSHAFDGGSTLGVATYLTMFARGTTY